MSPPVTLYRFKIEVADVDRNFYDSLDFRAAQHPSEAPIYLITRVLALALSFEEGLAFTPGGLSDTDEPALRSVDQNGSAKTWIEIGNPSARRLHKASKAAAQVKIFTYKDPALLIEELQSERIHQLEKVEIYSIAPDFLHRLAAKLEKQNEWQLLRDEENLVVSLNGESETGQIQRHRLR